ncbi:MAG: tetratricopeptide repeat protein [Rhodospirillaceae bacterium]|nr:tetratricopeptide repeat protein [Rhodospirillaceae bacterium]MBT4699928.1 tetratricopeptide repeat protein [Rhodospirillaceae bacterium]MBT5036059.1 tetratricopeptide repeat protein [Rhodospirillaceae bacterium]MBT6220557.1 tetratricopeptide repeat protein [Rhodospirillaceae bacterium]MBT6362752.1 tetratricopeptide repeat protein [Rhodospirillaceae bacterium]
MSLTIEQLFQQATQKVQTGDWTGAGILLEGVLSQTPEHGDALHFLGLIRYQSGDAEAAVPLLQKAAAATANHPAVMANYGSVLNALGRWPEAEVAHRQALKGDPGNPQALAGLATALMELGRPDEALEFCEQAVQSDATNPASQITLGNIYRRLGELDQAVEGYKQAIKLAPSDAMAHANMGAALRELGKLDAAETACRKAIDLRPDYAEAYNNLGNVLQAADDGEAALVAFRRALTLNPNMSDAEANRGATLYRMDRLEEAEAAYHEAIALNPGDAKAYNGLGIVQLALGRTDDAVGQFRRAVDLNPLLADAFYNLASSRGEQFGDSDVATVEDLISKGTVDHSGTVLLHFALAEVADQRQDWDNAFEHARQGNTLRRELLEAEGNGFDADTFDAWVGEIIGVFDGAYFQNNRASAKGSDKPVFVVGMPRSGTTLVEQILAAHPDVHGAGELDRISMIAKDLSAGSFPSGFKTAEQTDISRAAKAHVKSLGELGEGALRVIDKTPFNFLYLGLIAQAFPGASLIHCMRDPRDTAISCYFQNFVSAHAWSTDLGDIARYIRAYGRIMDHWREVLPVTLTEVRYESLVADQEAESRRLIEAVGLAWDDACLNFYKSPRPVKTASSWQVRRPIHGGAVARWRRYEKQLGPYVDLL